MRALKLNNLLHAQSVRSRSIVCTITVGLVRTILQPQSIVSTKAFCLAKTNLLAPSGLDSLNYCPAASCD